MRLGAYAERIQEMDDTIKELRRQAHAPPTSAPHAVGNYASVEGTVT